MPNLSLHRRLGIFIVAVVFFVDLDAQKIFGQQANVPTKPNILFIFADDLSHKAVGYTGETEVTTPNLDQLAKHSVRFSHAYNMGSWSGAVCIASRTMLITGRNVWDAQRIYASTDQERKANRLWPQLLSQAGYETYFSGKWHIQTDASKCFDHVAHVRPGMPETVESAYDRPRADRPDTWRSDDVSLGGFWSGGKHWSEVTADDAISFLDAASEKPSPFFMYIAFNAPHDPRQAPTEFLTKYDIGKLSVPKSFVPEYPFARKIGCGPDLRDEKLAPFPRTELSIQTHRREYFASISHLDEQIGRVLAKLHELKLDSKTYVIFTADHGLAVGEHGLMGKQNMYEHSIRVPFLLAGPGITPGVNPSPIYLQDAMATSLAIAHAEVPSHVHFQNLLPLATENKPSKYQHVYSSYLGLQRTVRVGDWKLIWYPKADVIRLYNLAEDPEELNDLAKSERGQKELPRLKQAMREAQRDLGDGLAAIEE